MMKSIRIALFAMLVVFFGCFPGSSWADEKPVEARSNRRWTDEDLAEAVKVSKNFHQVFKALGLKVGGGQWSTIKRRIAELKLDISHFQLVRVEYTDAQLVEAVKKSTSIREVLRQLGCNPEGGGTNTRVRERIRSLELDTSHFTGQGWRRGRKTPRGERTSTPLSEILVCDCRYSATA